MTTWGEDRFQATADRPERFKVFVCADFNCPRWWPAEFGSGYCDAHDGRRRPPPMRPLTLIAERDAGHPDWDRPSSVSSDEGEPQ